MISNGCKLGALRIAPGSNSFGSMPSKKGTAPPGTPCMRRSVPGVMYAASKGEEEEEEEEDEST